MVYAIQLANRIRTELSSVLILLASCQQDFMTHTIAVLTMKTPDDGQRNCLKHVEFYSKNKFEKLVHLVGFIIRTYMIPIHSSVLKVGHSCMSKVII